MSDDAVVHVVDDDEAVRESIAFLLGTAKVPVRVYASANDLLQVLPSIKKGCIVTDIRMPGMSGLELLARLKDLGLQTPVIVITGHGDVRLAVEAMKLGATEFLEKPFDDELLLAGVRSALATSTAETNRKTDRAEMQRRLSTLSQRERQVLDGLVVGHPNKTIAFDLKISPRTVEVYRANAMAKMEASSLSDLIRMAFTAGILDSNSGASDS